MTITNAIQLIYITILLIVIVLGYNYFDNRLDEIQDEIASINYSDLTIQVNNATWQEIDSTNKPRNK